ncbi:Uncharacterized protein BCGR_4290 [Mycobacterium tuberculosis variant bovis BCG]|nr:Uncharacterized protein BCGR_4290 [Mycobacterium tuberculosis variant bovis BCG]
MWTVPSITSRNLPATARDPRVENTRFKLSGPLVDPPSSLDCRVPFPR